MIDLTPNQWTLLESLKDGAVWTRSFQPVKPLLDDLIKRQLVDRCRPMLGRGRNMVRLSPEGCALLELDPARVPQFRDGELKLCKPARARNSNRTAAARTLLEDIERWCASTDTKETAIGHVLFRHPGFVGLLRKRLTVSEDKEAAARDFLSLHPKGYRGALPTTHIGSNAAVRARRMVDVRHIEIPPDVLPTRIERAPCTFCGVRADFGCRHQSIGGS